MNQMLHLLFFISTILSVNAGNVLEEKLVCTSNDKKCPKITYFGVCKLELKSKRLNIIKNKFEIWRNSAASDPGQGDYDLILQTNGDLVVKNQGDNAWKSGSGNRNTIDTYNLILTKDCELKIVDAKKTEIWKAVTYGCTGICSSKMRTLWYPSNKARLVLQDDGNLFYYDVFGRPKWSSSTTDIVKGKGPYKFGFTLDGKLEIYGRNDKAVWSRPPLVGSKGPCVLQVLENSVYQICNGQKQEAIRKFVS